MKMNEDIRNLMRKYKITYAELLKYFPNYSHTTRLFGELAKPLTDERKKVYLLAIEKIKAERRKLFED